MQPDNLSSSGLSNEPNSSLNLSPVIETQEDDDGGSEDRFADALEDSFAEDIDEKKESPKRDSKFEDDFADALQSVEIKEEVAMQEEPVNIEKPQEPELETLDHNENETTQTQNQPQNQTQTEVQPAEVQIEAQTEPQSETQQEIQQEDDNRSNKSEYLSQPVLVLLIIGLCLSVLLVSLDRTIITTAIPAITNEFGSTSAVGWYGSSYLVTACALQPTYGRIYTLFDVKWTFLHSVAIFEVGSLICALAPNSTVLIIGRAIAGWGSAGILTGAFVVIAFAVPLHKRPIYTASIGMMYGAGAAAGPVLGGVFTGMVTWRWCFYFNLPIASVTLMVVAFFFKKGANPYSHHQGYLQRLSQIDIPGSAMILVSFTMLFLALEYNSSGYAWSSALVIGLLCGFGSTLVIFLAWQWYCQDKALIVPSIILKRTVGAACLLAFFIYAVMILHGYYLPIWFQAIKGTSTESSGVNMLAYVLPNAVFGLLTGIFITRVGYFTPPAIIGCAITAAGAGLISTIQPTTSTVTWAGFICFVSAGVGMAIQQSFTAVQSVLRLEHIPIATAAVTCFQSLGGAVFISIGNSILTNEFQQASQANELPDVDIASILSAGATQFRSIVSPDDLPVLIDIYNSALQKVFVAAIPMAGIAFISTLLMEWRSVKQAHREAPIIEPATADEPPVLSDVEVETRISPITTGNAIASRENSRENISQRKNSNE